MSIETLTHKDHEDLVVGKDRHLGVALRCPETSQDRWVSWLHVTEWGKRVSDE